MRWRTYVPYSATPQKTLLIDLYWPDPTRVYPVVLWIIGGGWYSCAREDAPRWLTDYGFAVASIDYRLSTEATAPAQIHDAKAAVRWLRANAAECMIDPTRIGVAGSSAGGHLTALLAGSTGVTELEGHGGNAGWPSYVSAFCNLCGPADLTTVGLPENRTTWGALYACESKLLGGPVEERTALAKLMSPTTYLDRRWPPGHIIHGTADSTVPLAESVKFYEALKQRGVDVGYTQLEGAGHVWDKDLTMDVIERFFQRTLG